MAAPKLKPPPILMNGGLNFSQNKVARKPNQLLLSENCIVAKPYGYNNPGASTIESGHVLQTRPFMRAFQNAATFGFQTTSTGPEVKPLVGATQTPGDDRPSEWQTIVKGITGEGWLAVGTGPGAVADTAQETTPFLTKSDGNNVGMTQMSTGISISAPSTSNPKDLHVTLTDAYNRGNIGNLDTTLYVNYEAFYKLDVVAFNPLQSIQMDAIVQTLKLRIGLDSSNYLEYDLPVGTHAAPPATTRIVGPFADGTDMDTLTYGVYSKSVNIRSYDAKVGTKPMGEIFNNITYIRLYATMQTFYYDSVGTPTGLVVDFQFLTTALSALEVIKVDHVRLDVDYEGFFADFKVDQPYLQRTVDPLDLSSAEVLDEWTLGPGFYPERRLSIGNGCIAFESDVARDSVADRTLDRSIDTTVSGFPQSLLVDFRLENFDNAKVGAQEVWIGTDSANYYIFALTNNGSADGNQVKGFSFPATSKFGNPDPADLNYVAVHGYVVTGVAEPNSFRLYVNNIRFASCDYNTLIFTANNGFIRDVAIYDATDVGQNSRFVSACGDTLFGGGADLADESFYIQGGFTNYDPANGLTLQDHFNYSAAANPAFINSAELDGAVVAGAPSITLTNVTGIYGGKELSLDVGGLQPETIVVEDAYTPGTLTVALKNVLKFDHDDESSVTWTSPSEPKNVLLFVNGHDGYYSYDIVDYPLPGGGTYPYPRLRKIDDTAYKTLETWNANVCLAGDPDFPNRVVLTDDNDPFSISPGRFFEMDLQGKIVSGDFITALNKFENLLIVSRNSGSVFVYGTSINNLDQKPTSATKGPMSQRHIFVAKRRVFFMAWDGVYELVGSKDVKISDPIHAAFQLNDFERSRACVLNYNPIREILIVGMPDALTDPPVMGNTVAPAQYTYSLENGAWGHVGVCNNFGAILDQQSVLVVGTANVNLAVTTVGVTIDGVVIANNNLFLLTGQTDPTQNGVWQAHTAAVSTRGGIFTTAGAFATRPNCHSVVPTGGSRAGQVWESQADVITLGTDSISFSRVIFTNDPRNYGVSAIYYGGGGSSPKFFVSSYSLLEWDNSPEDGQKFSFDIKTVPNHLGDPRRMKTYDKMFLDLDNAPTGGLTVDAAFTMDADAYYPQVAGMVAEPGETGFIEQLLASGSEGRAVSIRIRPTTPTAWDPTAPVQFQAYGLTYFQGEEL